MHFLIWLSVNCHLVKIVLEARGLLLYQKRNNGNGRWKKAVCFISMALFMANNPSELKLISECTSGIANCIFSLTGMENTFVLLMIVFGYKLLKSDFR